MRFLFNNSFPRTVGMICAATLLVTGVATGSHAATVPHDSRLDLAVWNALNSCKTQKGCEDAARTAKGVLVFPTVTKADLILGGAGGKGALIQGGKITGYYSIGAGSAGLQAGIDNSSQVYAFQKTDALDKLKSGQDWNVGLATDVAVNRADAAAAVTTASVDAFVFDAKGLEAGASVNAFDIWKTGNPRPKF
jgi:lipid-binding SYLF domain-containing protein